MATAQPTREEEFLTDQNAVRENSFNIMNMMVDLWNQTPGSKHLVDEILHCIFFLGQVNKIRYTPEEFINDEEMLAVLTEKYPRPIQFYSTQLPKRSPFSCVMDMIVKLERPENENQIKQRLMKIARMLKPTFPVSSTMCVSQPPNSANKYYGVSMSTTGPNPGRIVIAAACLSNWDDYVAEAVMAYSREKKEEEKKKGNGKGKGTDDNRYFDGTIRLKKGVKCQAFSLSTRDGPTPMDPCKSCGELFGLQTDETKGWVYGNCAEAESLSNLLKNEQEVKNQTRREDSEYTPQNRQRNRESMIEYLKETLRTVQFREWHTPTYYTPQDE